MGYENEEEGSENSGGDTRSFNFTTLKADNELFNEEKYVAHSIINVKRISKRNGIEDWQVLENNQLVLLMKGTRFTNAEKEFLRTVEGVQFIIKEYKSGVHSVVKLKERLKEIL